MMKRSKLEPHNMDYNSDKEILLYPEYGRNIQAMILEAKGEPNMEKRQLMIEAIVNLMYQMNPQSKNVDDYKEKLWKHVFHLAEYNLGGVLPPSGIHPTPDDAVKRPETIPYPVSGARFRHYGNNVHQLIKKALQMEDPAKQAGMVNTIGAYMKLAYRTWNKEHFVSDEIIKTDLEALSDGRLHLQEDVAIDRLSSGKRRMKDHDRPDNRGGGGNSYRSGGQNDRGERSDRNTRGNSNRSQNERGGNRNQNQNDRNRGNQNRNNPNDNRRK